MDFQLKLTFTGKSHKTDLDFQSGPNKSLKHRLIITLTIICVQTAIRLLKMEENSVTILSNLLFFIKN